MFALPGRAQLTWVFEQELSLPIRPAERQGNDSKRSGAGLGSSPTFTTLGIRTRHDPLLSAATSEARREL